ncbi:MAG: hypothetical protein ACC653_08955 [Gammaproteobacteria bacterium]
MMNLKMCHKITSYFAILLTFGLYTVSANAKDEYKFNLGVKLLASSWNGKNNSSGTSYKQDEGGQFGWNIGLQKGRFYTGLSLQGGEYNFTGEGPEQVTANTTVNVTNVKVTRSEFDLIAGYYFWDNISFFLDLKSITNKHNKNNYEQKFSGLGLGIAGAWPINDDVALYGSFGFFTKVDVEANGKKVGSANNVALEFGAAFRINDANRLNAGIKAQSQEYTFDNGTTQNHDVASLFVGYNYIFGF